MIREAVEADIPALLDLFEQCHAASVYEAPFDRAYAESYCRALMAHDDALVLTNGSAVLITVLAPLHFSPAKQAVELVFWGKGGGELIRRAQAWAKDRGAVRFAAANEHTEKHKAMNRWYRREGLEPVATTYARSL